MTIQFRSAISVVTLVLSQFIWLAQALDMPCLHSCRWRERYQKYREGDKKEWPNDLTANCATLDVTEAKEARQLGRFVAMRGARGTSDETTRKKRPWMSGTTPCGKETRLRHEEARSRGKVDTGWVTYAFHG